MKISDVVKELESIKQEHGDIPVVLQDNGNGNGLVVGYENFFIVAEEYQPIDGGWTVNIRTWPY